VALRFSTDDLARHLTLVARIVARVRNPPPPQPMFEPKARILYAIIVAELALAVVLYSALGMRFADVGFALPSWTFGLILVSAFAARRAAFPRVATWLEATALAYIGGLAGWALLFPATALSLPFADPWLSAVDKALGFNFVALDSWMHGRLYDQIYHSFGWQAALIIPILIVVRRDVWALVYALTFAMMLTYLLYPLAPAMGPRVFYGLVPADPQTLMIRAMRDQHVRTITRQMIVGMVSFPSFHAATAVIFAWAMWPVRLLRWPFLALNGAVLLTTMTEGDHYLVDVIAGIAVAAVAICLCRWQQRHHRC
jgi:membrane-associated phospholipid phosphatase